MYPIFLDTETTGLEENARLVQLAYKDSKTGEIVAYPGDLVGFFDYPPRFDVDSRLLVFNSKDFAKSLEGKDLKDLINNEVGRFVAGLERAYYLIVENDDGPVRLDKICSENVLDGLYGQN